MPAINITIPTRELRMITAFCEERGINRSKFLREKAMESIKRSTGTDAKQAGNFTKWPKDNVDFSQCPLALWLKAHGEDLP